MRTSEMLIPSNSFLQDHPLVLVLEFVKEFPSWDPMQNFNALSKFKNSTEVKNRPVFSLMQFFTNLHGFSIRFDSLGICSVLH